VRRGALPARRRLASFFLLLGLVSGILLLAACGGAPTKPGDATPTPGGAGPVATLMPAAPDGLLADLSRAIKAAFAR
jgi:hypothetical protein